MDGDHYLSVRSTPRVTVENSRELSATVGSLPGNELSVLWGRQLARAQTLLGLRNPAGKALSGLQLDQSCPSPVLF
jgi:hypothetical protein